MPRYNTPYSPMYVSPRTGDRGPSPRQIAVRDVLRALRLDFGQVIEPGRAQRLCERFVRGEFQCNGHYEATVRALNAYRDLYLREDAIRVRFGLTMDS